MRYLVLVIAFLIAGFAAACEQGEEANQPAQKTTETPSGEEPSAEKPSTEEPSAEEPSTEEPAEEPSTEEDSTAAPSDNGMAEPQDETQPQ